MSTNKKGGKVSSKLNHSKLVFGDDIGIEELNKTENLDYLLKINVLGDLEELKKKENHVNDEAEDDNFAEKCNEDAKNYSNQSSELGEDEEKSTKKSVVTTQKPVPSKSALKSKDISREKSAPQINIVKFTTEDNEDYEASDSLDDNNDDENLSNDLEEPVKSKKETKAKTKKSLKSEVDDEEDDSDEEDEEADEDADVEEMNDNMVDDEDFFSDNKKMEATRNPNAKRIKYDFDESKGPEQFLKVIAMDGGNKIYKLSDLNYPYYEDNDGSSEKKNNNYESLIEFAKKELEKSKFNEIYQKELEKKQSAFQPFFENELKPVLIQELNRKMIAGGQTFAAFPGKGDDAGDKKSQTVYKFKFIRQVPEFKRKRSFDLKENLKDRVASKEYFVDLKKFVLQKIRTNENFSNKNQISFHESNVRAHTQKGNTAKKQFTQIILHEKPSAYEEDNFFQKDFNKNIARKQSLPTASPLKSQRLTSSPLYH